MYREVGLRRVQARQRMYVRRPRWRRAGSGEGNRAMCAINATEETAASVPSLANSERHRRGRLTAGVFFVAAAAYLLLMSGHIYARDEETLFQMADSIARHGTTLVSPEVWGIAVSPTPGKDGLLTTSYAPGQSLLAVPLYWLGAAVAHTGGTAYAAYLHRFVVLTFNGFVTAATVALLFCFALALGYRTRTALALAICYGGATYALIQARTFFAEPLTALLVLLAFFLMYEACAGVGGPRRCNLVLAASGFVIACALGVKVHAALFLPVLALYLLLSTVPSVRALSERAAWQSLVRRGGAWVAGMAIPAVALMAYNAWLYGSPLTTGYGDSPNIFTTPLRTGVYGLLFSSGKGVLWYAPPILLALIGLPIFLRRFPRVGITIICAGVINVVFYARLRFWHGEGAWGPRYLLIVLPWLLLPALPVLDRLLAPARGWWIELARAGAAFVVLAGVFVQMLAIAVSFDVPVLTTTDEHARFFTPAQSPIVTAARTANQRLRTWWRDGHPYPNTLVLRDGFYSAEGDAGAAFPRWTGGAAIVTLHPANGAALHVKLTYFDDRPAAMRATPTPVTVAIGGVTLSPVDRLPIAPANEGFILAYDVSPDLFRQAGNRLTISAPTWNPAAAQVSQRDEDLGIFVNNLEVWADGVPLAVRQATMIPAVPASPRQVWLWANYPEYPHTLDSWPILLHDARLPARLVVGITAGMLGSAALLLIGGVLCFWRVRAPAAIVPRSSGAPALTTGD